jgi:hypothetical protein
MRHNATQLGIASAIAKRGSRRRSRGERLRAAAQTLTENSHGDVDVIDEAFAGFTRVDSPAAQYGVQSGEIDGKFPASITECLSAQLNALDRQRSELVQLLRTIGQESQSR